MFVETQAQADTINRDGIIGPLTAANGHRMMYAVDPPRETRERTDDLYRVGDRIRYRQWDAWCADTCHHDSPPEDW